MVASILRLKLTLLRNSLRRSTAVLVGMVLGALYALFLVGLAVAGLVALRFAADPGTARAVVVIAGAAFMVGWVLVPLLVFGVDQTLDPARFATFAVPRRDMVLGSLLAGLVGVPGAAGALLCLATVITYSRTVAAVPVALAGAVIGLLTCVALSRAVTTAASALLESRRGREVGAALGVFAAIVVGPTVSVVSQRAGSWGAVTDRVVAVVAWTPLGLPWAAGGDAGSGHLATAVQRLLLAAVVLALVLLWWSRALQRAAEEPRVSSGGGTVHTGLGWFARLPATPTGAVVARTLTYWRRDPRYISAVGILPFLPLAMVLPSLIGGHGRGLVLFMGPAVAWLMGFSLHNDLAYDGTAFWAHVASGVGGVADRVGRLVPIAALAVLLVPAYSVLGALLAGRADVWPAVLGAAAVMLLAGFGLASVASAVKPYPVPAAGENPFSSPAGASGLALLVQLVTSAATVLLASPVLVLAAFAVWGGRAGLGWVALLLAIVLGAAYLVVGVRLGARLFERRAPLLLAELTRAR
ncbi:hypothetical protein [Oryzihumus sp.]